MAPQEPTRPQSPDGLLDSPQLAARLGCTERMVRKMTAERRIPFVKVGRLVRFRPQDVEAFVSSNLVEAR